MSGRRNRCASFGAAVAAACALFAASVAAGAEPGYLRSPDLHGPTIVFTAEGDLWTASDDGRDVRRITSHAGDETGAKFSPDGSRIAFSGFYDGNTDLYVMPSAGGEPRRLTWHPAPDFCIGWSRDGSRIYFLSFRESPNRSPDFFSIPASGGEPEKVPIGWISTFDEDAATGRFAFTRTAGGGTWKRYRGGTAADIWVGDPRQADYRRITDFEGADLYPMWHGGRIYFLCDQGGTMNIWSLLPDGSDRRKHTDFDGWDARHASMSDSGRIVFTLAGNIHVFDPAAGSERLVPIDLPSERILTRKRYPDAERYLTWFTLSPDAERLAIVTRGEIFSVPAEEGVTLPVTHGSGARERDACYDPAGKKVVYISDASGEEEIMIADAWGRGGAKRLKKAAESNWFFPPTWSPDGKQIAYADENQDLYVVDADGGEPVLADHCDFDEIRDYVWSPDGRWLAYSKSNDVDIRSVYIYDTKEKKVRAATGWTTDDHTPAWDPDGRFLYFLSDRVMNPHIGWRDFETIEAATTRPYMLLLRPDVENPLVARKGIPPKEGAEEEKGKKKEEEKKGRKEKEKSEDEEEEKAPEPVEIDFEGLAERYLELPVETGRYYGLAATSKKVFYLSRPPEGLAEDFDFDDEPKPKASLLAFDLEEKEASTFLDGVSAFEVGAKKEKIAVMKRRGEIYVVDASSAPKDIEDAKVSLSDLVVELDPREEWRQIFFEGWRNMRDFYWDEGMHGIDWKAVRDRYATLLPRLATRDDLRDLMAEMIGELATSHTYVWGGDSGKDVPGVSTGTVGAELAREGDAFRVTRIYRADPADRVRSPLEEPGVAVREGDYILAVNGLPFPPNEPFEASLENLAGKEVLLTVNDRRSREGARDVVAKPLRGREAGNLLYADWVRRNRERVAEKTGGKMGYIHVPDMGGRGLAAFDRWFYPQLEREGMVVDMRWNGGGFVSQLIVSRLARNPVMFGRARGGDTWNWPARVLNGPFVVLTNEFAGSDGDLGPFAIQQMELAPIIGKRSWGGVIGIRGDKPLVDGGVETQPEYAYWAPSVGWGLENRGVEPDIEVDNLPQEIGRGIDAQLDRGIEELLRLHKERPPAKPAFEPAPDRSRKAYRREL